MPQLMPLFWIFSFMMVFLFLMFMVMVFSESNKKVDLVGSNISVKIKMWLW